MKQVTAVALHTGSQSWRYGRGYGSPAVVPIFAPIGVSVGRPSSGSAGDIANRQVRLQGCRARRRVRGERLPGSGGPR